VLLPAGIKGIWNLQKSSSDNFDTYLVLAFVGETRILEINGEDELDEAEIEGFDAEQQVQLAAILAACTTVHLSAATMLIQSSEQALPWQRSMICTNNVCFVVAYKLFHRKPCMQSVVKMI